jgi:hypothetical protein
MQGADILKADGDGDLDFGFPNEITPKLCSKGKQTLAPLNPH